MSFQFTAFRAPFPEWHGPYSQSHGRNRGFRVRGRQLITFVDSTTGLQMWIAQQTDGVLDLQDLVCRHWGGGRVLLLPNGLVVKPNPAGDGECWAIGQFLGPVVLERPDGTDFNLADPGPLEPGDPWPGPATTGIECVIDRADGSLRAEIRTPTPDGFLRERYFVIESDESLADGFSVARPGDGGGRVRVTANGHVITNRQRFGRWECVYVGQIDVTAWPHLDEWAAGVELSPPYQLDVESAEDAIDVMQEFDETFDVQRDVDVDSFINEVFDGEIAHAIANASPDAGGESDDSIDSFFERLDENEAPYEDDEYDEDFIEEDEEDEEEAE